MKRLSISMPSGDEVYYTIFKTLLVKIMLCSRLRCQKVLKLKVVSYQILGSVYYEYDFLPGHWRRKTDLEKKGSNSLWGIVFMMHARSNEVLAPSP